MAVVQKLLSAGSLGGGGLGLCLTHHFHASSQVVEVPVAVAGSFRNWRLQLASTPGEDITRTIRKNGADTALSLFFSASETLKSDADSVAFAAGDRFVIGRIGNPSVNCASMLEWVPDDGQSQLYSFACGTFVSGRYLGVLNTGSEDNATEASVSSLVGVNGTVTVLRVKCANDPGVGKTRVYTLCKNGVAQDGSGGTTDTRATIPSGNTTASASFSLSVVAGDRLSLRCDGTGGATDDDMAGSIAFVGATETVMYGGATSNTAGTTAGTSFRPPFSWSALTPDSGVTENDWEFAGADGLTIGAMRLYLPTAPSAGQSRVFTLRVNGADTDLSVTLSDTTQAGSDSATAIPIGYSDEWALKEVRTGTPASTVVKYVFTSGSTLSERNALIGEAHTATASRNNFIVGKDGATTGVSQVALFNMKDSDPFEFDEADNAFIVNADIIRFNEIDIEDLGGGVDDASFVTLGTHAELTDERVLTAGAGVTITDGGAGSTVTIAANGSSGGWSILTNGDPVSPEIIFDSNGDTIGVFEP